MRSGHLPWSAPAGRQVRFRRRAILQSKISYNLLAPEAPSEIDEKQIFYSAWKKKGRRGPPACVVQLRARLILDASRVERGAVLPTTVDRDVIAGAETPNVDRTRTIHVPNVDLVVDARGIVTHGHVTHMAVRTLNDAAHPTGRAKRHAAIHRIGGEVRIA